MTKLRQVAAAAAILGALASPAHAELISNGGFESGSTAGWTFTGGDSDVVSTAPFFLGGVGGFGFLPGGHGGFAALLATQEFVTGSALSQTFLTTPGGTYTLQFDFGAFGNAQAISVSLSNSSLGSFVLTDPTGTHNNALLFSHYAYAFTATGASSTLTIADTGLNVSSALVVLDNISVVPAPGGLALLAFGLAALGLRRRRG